MPKRPHTRSHLAALGLVIAALAAFGLTRSTHADEPTPVVPASVGTVHGEGVSMPASTLGANAAPSERALPPADPGLDTPVPTEWQPNLMRCRRYRRQRYCEGPRRIPLAFGSSAERAERLGLGTRRAAARVKEQTPPAEWVAEVEGTAHESLFFPVDEGRQGRGLSRGRGRHPGHDGVDIMARVGARVRSVDDGLVVYADNELRGYGNVLLILHRDGTVALYAHLRSAYVFAGQSVRQGQVLGEVGETGLARGSHLHFELRRNGRPENPIPRFVRPTDPGAPTAARGLFTTARRFV